MEIAVICISVISWSVAIYALYKSNKRGYDKAFFDGYLEGMNDCKKVIVRMNPDLEEQINDLFQAE